MGVELPESSGSSIAQIDGVDTTEFTVLSHPFFLFALKQFHKSPVEVPEPFKSRGQSLGNYCVEEMQTFVNSINSNGSHSNHIGIRSSKFLSNPNANPELQASAYHHHFVKMSWCR
jgi:hypothetical protein